MHGGEDANVLGRAGYHRSKPPFRPMLDEFVGVIDPILAADTGGRRSRGTSKRIFQRLRDEYGFADEIATENGYVSGVSIRP
jgi:hypothetical protein